MNTEFNLNKYQTCLELYNEPSIEDEENYEFSNNPISYTNGLSICRFHFSVTYLLHPNLYFVWMGRILDAPKHLSVYKIGAKMIRDSSNFPDHFFRFYLYILIYKINHYFY